MTPAMYIRVRDSFVRAGLTDGFTTQLLFWNDGKATESFMVFRPRGGTDIQKDLGADYYVGVDVIGAKGTTLALNDAVQNIIEYVTEHGSDDDCLGYIQNLGGLPEPILTDEGRVVFRLQFVCVFGD